MKIQFIHQGPHSVHAAFAETITKDWKYYGNNRNEIIKIFIRSIFEDNEKYDIIFSEGGSGLPMAALKKIKHPTTKIVLLNADKFFYLISRTSFLKKVLMKSLIKFVEDIIAISELNKRMALKHFPEEKIHVVNSFGVNVNFETQAPLNNKNILFIGDERVSDKRFNNLVEAVKYLNNQNANLNLYLVGNCGNVIKEDFKWLHKIGYTSKPEKYFKECSLYVHPAEFDPCPVVIFEAMSAGLIPIITKFTGQCDILKSNNLEFLILDNNDYYTISKEIMNFYSLEKSKKVKISKKCKEISSEYTKKGQQNKFQEIFKNLINKYQKS